MLQTHFPSTKATQNKSNVENRFGDRDFLLAVCTSFLCNFAVSQSFVIFVRSRMAEFHFRSLEAPQNKSDVTSRFGDRNCILAVCTRFLRKCGRFEVIRNFPS
jgi:hypothetical protein